MQKWLKEGRPVYSGFYTPGEGLPEDGDYSFEVQDPTTLVSEISKVHEIAGKLHAGSTEWQITDARAAARFNGEMPEPRNMRAGNITGSINLPYSSLLDEETGGLKSEAELKLVF